MKSFFGLLFLLLSLATVAIPALGAETSPSFDPSQTVNGEMFQAGEPREKPADFARMPGAPSPSRRSMGTRQSSRTGFQPTGDFSVVTLGTGSPQYSADRSGPSSLIQYHGHYILVDMGNGTQARLHEAGISWRQIDALVITHHHLDHNEELIPLFIHTHLTGRTVPVIGPPGTSEYIRFIKKFYAQDISYRLQRIGRTMADFGASPVREVKGGDSFVLDGMKVTTAEMNHSIFTVGYRFEADGKSIVISGDTAYTDHLVQLARGSDLLVMDSGGAPVRSAGHASARRRPDKAGGDRPRSGENRGGAIHAHASREEVCEMASRAAVKELVLTHIGPGKVDEQATIEALGKLYHGRIVVGRDLLEVVAGQATPRSVQAAVSQPSQSRFIRRFDRDGDGKVSRQEFDGPAARFNRLDTNHDGYISSDEAPQGPRRSRKMRGRT
jgi:ribonuclease BN (tRNA processing enzyme)